MFRPKRVNVIDFKDLSAMLFRQAVSPFGTMLWRGCKLSGGKAACPHCMVGITNSAPSFTPDGQREVTVFVLV